MLNDRVIRRPTLLFGSNVEDLVDKNLITPVLEFLSRPSKNLRALLVEIGYGLSRTPEKPSSENQALCEGAAEIVEAVHAGSLVVDDIQDESLERRGGPTLHRQYGIPLALNAGNWLYFWPLDKMSHWDLPAETKNRLYEVCNDALLKAHYGQALDVGIRIDELPQERIESVCLASLELKTGALTALAIKLGAVLGNADPARLEALNHFGHSFGIALQMFDDIGNLKGKSGQTDPKRFEDLKLRRPSWIWAVVGKYFSAVDFRSFRNEVDRLPDATGLLAWAEDHQLIRQATALANTFLDKSLADLLSKLPPHTEFSDSWIQIQNLSNTLKKAYL